MRDPKKMRKAKAELRTMLNALSGKDYFETFFKVGKFQARKRLADGTVVRFSVSER